MGKRLLSAEDEAALAEWLTMSRAQGAPLEAYRGRRLPLEAMHVARNSGLMGVTQKDSHRLMLEVASRATPDRLVGPPPIGPQHRPSADIEAESDLRAGVPGESDERR